MEFHSHQKQGWFDTPQTLCSFCVNLVSSGTGFRDPPPTTPTAVNPGEVERNIWKHALTQKSCSCSVERKRTGIERTAIKGWPTMVRGGSTKDGKARLEKTRSRQIIDRWRQHSQMEIQQMPTSNTNRSGRLREQTLPDWASDRGASLSRKSTFVVAFPAPLERTVNNRWKEANPLHAWQQPRHSQIHVNLNEYIQVIQWSYLVWRRRWRSGEKQKRRWRQGH